MQTEPPEFLVEAYDQSDPSPWLALYLDQSVPMADQAKRAWLEDLSSTNRQFVLPFTRPFARLSVALMQVLKLVLPHVQSSKLLHDLLAWNMKCFLTPQAAARNFRRLDRPTGNSVGHVAYKPPWQIIGKSNYRSTCNRRSRSGERGAGSSVKRERNSNRLGLPTTKVS